MTITAKKTWRRVLSACLNTFFVTFMVIGSVLIFHNLYFTPVKVVGQSMMPTLQNNDFGVMDTHSGAIDKIDRFDIIIVNYPVGSDYFIIKRVIGLPGETLSENLSNGALTVDGVAVEEPFISTETLARTCAVNAGVACNTTVTLSATQYYVLGDNRGNSTDSEHGIGLVTYDMIKGVLFAIEGTCSDTTTSSGSDGAHIRICPIRSYRWPTFY